MEPRRERLDFSFERSFLGGGEVILEVARKGRVQGREGNGRG